MFKYVVLNMYSSYKLKGSLLNTLTSVTSVLIIMAEEVKIKIPKNLIKR